MFFMYSPEQLLNLLTYYLIRDWVASLGDRSKVIFYGEGFDIRERVFGSERSLVIFFWKC